MIVVEHEPGFVIVATKNSSVDLVVRAIKRSIVVNRRQGLICIRHCRDFIPPLWRR